MSEAPTMPKFRFYQGRADVHLDGYRETTTPETVWALFESVVDGAEYVLGEDARSEYWLLYPVLARHGAKVTIDEKKPIAIRKGGA